LTFSIEEFLDSAKSTLRELVAENDYAVGTGFAGTQHLGFALSRADGIEEFYRMLMRTEVPSWLYQVVMNGTTTWERWDSLLPNGDVNPGSMTSFNHYAFGSVANWIHQYVGGLSPAEPGWKTVFVTPVPGGGIDHAEATFVSPYGRVTSSWTVDGQGFHLKVSIPPNSRAIVSLPNGEEEEVGSGHHEYHVPA
jgi:alpha-L-rhamnosidase